MKVIDFQLLRDRVQNDLIPKFDLCKKIAKHSYLDLGVGQEKNKLLRELHSAFCFIDSSVSLDECRYEITKINSKPNTMTELGDAIQKAFGNRILNFSKLDQFDYQFSASGKPHLFLCQQRSAILRTVMKLLLSQGQQPAASRVLFCNENPLLFSK